MVQEVRELFPELVSTLDEENGNLGLDYSKFGVLAVRAIKEHQERIESQAKQLDEQGDRIEELEAQNGAMEDWLGAVEAKIDAGATSPEDD